MLFVFCGVVRFSAVVRFCGAWDCCDDSHGQKWIDSTKVKLEQLRRVIGYLKRNRKKQYTHKFVWAFSVMTSSSPFLPPSLGNTYRLFPLLVFRVKKKLTTATNRNFCDSKSCADKQNNANHFSSASARVESCFRMSRTIQTLSREPRSFIFVLSLRQR